MEVEFKRFSMSGGVSRKRVGMMLNFLFDVHGISLARIKDAKDTGIVY